MTWTTLMAVDIDPKACEVYAANVACERVVCGDIDSTLNDLPDADVIIGGPPCQPFSQGGQRLGDADHRDCVPSYISAIKRKQPRMFLMEQVEGFTNFRRGRYMQDQVSAMVRAGYRVSMKMIDAVDFGVPQFRNRAWFWGIRKDLAITHRWPHKTHKNPELIGTMFSDRWPWVRIQDAIDCGGEYTPYHYTEKCLYKHHPSLPDRPAWTVTANFHKQGSGGLLARNGRTFDSMHPVSVPDQPCRTIDTSRASVGGNWKKKAVRIGPDTRRLTTPECARLQTMPDDFVWPAGIAKMHRYRIIGNGWACLLAKRLGEAFKLADPRSETVIDLCAGGGAWLCRVARPGMGSVGIVDAAGTIVGIGGARSRRGGAIMLKIIDGPAAGVVLDCTRAPMILRVVRKGVVLDALDLPTDVPRCGEDVFAYRIRGRASFAHFKMQKRSQSGWRACADYVFIRQQPTREVMLDNSAWRDWCEANKGWILK